ncbi:MAG: O-antigen ligase family protein [Acidobacteria bacterium]|nr:O-antigen ligase family protein [Acidobacteriota bacterium]
MKSNEIFGYLDRLNGLDAEPAVVLWLERAAFVFLTVMVLFAPHSIAVTQSGWLIGMLAWVVALAVKRFSARGPAAPAAPPDWWSRLKNRPLQLALAGFFLWAVVSSAFSYAPAISLDKLRGVSLFLIFVFVCGAVRTLRAARFLAFALVFSAMVAVVWTPVERAIGRGVTLYDFAGSAFDEIGLRDGDTILEIDGKKVNSLDELRRRIFEHPEQPLFKALVYRADAYTPVDVSRARIKPSENAAEALGVRRWTRSHSWRAAGFYGHFTTFAEALQLIVSLAFGLFVALAARHRWFRPKGEPAATDEISERKEQRLAILLAVCLGLMALALLLTVTRASQFAFLVSALSIVFLRGNRRMIFLLVLTAVPAIVAGLIVYQSVRQQELNLGDESTRYREMMWRDGMRLWTASPRNFVLGVGMDSIQRYWPEWGLFDNGWQPKGHFHSTLVQLLVERGLPALLIWLAVLGIYARTLWRGLRARLAGGAEPTTASALETGILLGCFGGMIGFFTSGLVHYNLGDGEVAMIFYILMGLGVFICRARDRF